MIAAHQLKLEIYPSGSIVELKKNSYSIYVISSNEKTYKTSIIAAHVLNNSGYETYVLREKENKSNLLSDLKRKFQIEGSEIRDENESESESDILASSKYRKRNT